MARRPLPDRSRADRVTRVARGPASAPAVSIPPRLTHNNRNASAVGKTTDSRPWVYPTASRAGAPATREDSTRGVFQVALPSWVWKLGSLDPNRGATVKPRGASSTTMAGQGLYPTTNRGHLDSMVSGPTPAPPRREASAAVRAHASFCDIASVPIEPDPRRGPLLVSPRSNRHRPVNETPPLPLRRSSRALGSDSSPSRNAVTRSVPTA